MDTSGVRIAMWSGPRNISTALMRAWENRPDTIVCDEPFYPNYLYRTGEGHPGADEIVTKGETDPGRVVDSLTSALPDGINVFYQKHMGQHVWPEMPTDWMRGFRVGFLIRSPREMIASYLKVRGTITLEETGMPQQVDLYRMVAESTGGEPPVIDAADVLRDPRGMLAALCDTFGVPFTEQMLSWPAGKRDSDGIWAPYWYGQVERSTGFAPYEPKEVSVPSQYSEVLDRCNDLYDFLYEKRLVAAGAD